MHIGRLLAVFAALAGGLIASLSAQAQTAKSVLKDQAGKDVGAVQLIETPHGVLLKLALKGSVPGEHAFHIHAVGKCEPPFTTAGGHFNPANKKHGLAVAEGAHAGDMPNLHIPPNGELTIEILNGQVTLARGKPNSVFDGDGSAIVVHAGVDDYKSDPTGNAGDRIACGVIAE